MALSWVLLWLISFSSHVSCYANKALKIAQNLWIMGHCHSGINQRLRQQVYYAVCWSVMTYGAPLWFQLKGKGIKHLVAWLNKTQNMALCWIAGAFCTMPIPLLELFTGIAPVTVQLDFQLWNFLSRVSTVPHSHPLRQLATVLAPHSAHDVMQQQKWCAVSDNIHLLQMLIQDFVPFALFAPLLWLGHRVINIYSEKLG